MKDITVRVIFSDGGDMLMGISCPTDATGTHYPPLEFKTGRPDRMENVVVQADPYNPSAPGLIVYRQVEA